MLRHVIEEAFEEKAGTHQSETGKALHVGFHLKRKLPSDQYRVAHLYIFAFYNYVYVAEQEERIDRSGDRRIGKMKLLSCHDSCWKDAIGSWLYKHCNEMTSFQSLTSPVKCTDVIFLSQAEKDYLEALRHCVREKECLPSDNPFDARTVWKNGPIGPPIEEEL